MEQGKIIGRVKVQSLLSVVSSKPSGTGKIRKLSFLDQAMGLHTIHIVCYYTSNPFNDGLMASDLDNLRVSMSYLLDEYPNIMGRLTRGPDGGWQVKCNDAGVRILQATVSTTVDEWLRSADASEERDLTVWEGMPQDPTFWSPFRLQFNNFKCGGIAIGLSCTHMLADITSATLLIKSWAELHSAKPLTYSPIFNLPTHTSPQDNSIPPSFSTPNSHNTQPKMGTITMKFSGSTMEKCLSQVQRHCPNATPFDVLAALFWSRIVLLQEPQLDDQNHSLYICVDSRNQGRPPIPFGYLGNALNFSLLSVDADSLISGGLGQVCDHVHRHVSRLKGQDFKSFLSCKDGEEPPRVYGQQLTCINTEHMVDVENGEALMYSAVFNKSGRPVHVSYQYGNVAGQGLILVMPSAEAGLGRSVMVMLPEEQIAKLCEDQEILDLKPVLVISGRRS